VQKLLAWLLAVAAACTPGVTGLTITAAQGSLTGSSRLAGIYDTILGAHFDQARDELRDACPPAPEPACEVLREVTVWWEIQQNPWSRALDRRLEEAAGRAIDAARAWTEREPRRAEAWFYLAGAYAPLSQWRVLRKERLAAARDGKTIKNALERALELDPRLQDAYFGIGLYHYYADVAPAALKILRFLLLLPGGDREQGLREMVRARDRGELMRGEADYQLHWIYVWYEEEPGPALALLRGLESKYPSNPIFLQRVAEMQHENFSDHAASAASWALLLERAGRGLVHAPAMAAARARVGLASELMELGDVRRALTLAQDVVRAAPDAPYGVLAHAHLLVGDAYARLGDRVRAADAYAQAIARAPSDDPETIRRAREARARLGSR
jgi:tetratricopeptide (TPR) repeat protein